MEEAEAEFDHSALVLYRDIVLRVREIVMQRFGLSKLWLTSPTFFSKIVVRTLYFFRRIFADGNNRWGWNSISWKSSKKLNFGAGPAFLSTPSLHTRDCVTFGERFTVISGVVEVTNVPKVPQSAPKFCFAKRKFTYNTNKIKFLEFERYFRIQVRFE